MKRKPLIIGIIVIVAFVILMIGSLLFLAYEPDRAAADPTPSIGLANPDPLGAMSTDKVEHKEDREEQEASKPDRTKEEEEALDKAAISYLSKLDFSGLSQYIMRSAENYKTDAHTTDLKVDLANTMAATEKTAPILLMSYRTPEVLAAAVASMPMTYKLDSFLSADSLILPAQTGDVHLVKADVSDTDLAALLERANANTTSLDHCSEADAYDMTLNGLPCRLWTVKTPDGWRPYLLEQKYNYTTGTLTQLEAREIQQTLFRSGSTLDEAIYMPPFDEAAYLADMEANPDKYNEDRSMKKWGDDRLHANAVGEGAADEEPFTEELEVEERAINK